MIRALYGCPASSASSASSARSAWLPLLSTFGPALICCHVYEARETTDSDRTGMAGRVTVLVFDGVTMLDVTGPGEVLHQAGRLGAPYTYDVVLVSPRGGEVTTSSGLTLTGAVA
nr:AraC family transcriptional regulator [Streptomyces tsukubensis NRRL18488]